MHIPDGVLDPITVAATYTSIFIYAVIVRRYIDHLDTSRLGGLASLASIVFVAQLINWPIPGGTSLHLVGAGLLGAILGPYYGFFVMAVILTIQCIFFGDGGITALGANILNMGVIGVLAGYIPAKILLTRGPDNYRRVLATGFLSGWLSMTLAGFACGVEIGLSRYFNFDMSITVPIMSIYSSILGVIEGILTGLILFYLYRRGNGLHIMIDGDGWPSTFTSITILLIFVSPIFTIYLTSFTGYREPLDIVLDMMGYEYISLFPFNLFSDYTFPGLPSWLGMIIAGFIGVALIYIVFKLASAILR